MSIQDKEYTSKKTGLTTTKYYAVVYNPKTNKPVWSDGFDTRILAEREETRLIDKIKQEKIVTKKIKFHVVAGKWIVDCEKDYAVSTYKGYVYYLPKYVMPIFGDKWIGEVKADSIKKYMDVMIKKYSAEVVNKCVNILSNIFKYARDIMEVLETNPVEAISRLGTSPKQGNIWSAEQIADFLKYNKVVISSYRELINTSFAIGARPSEVCGFFDYGLSTTGVLSFLKGYVSYGAESNLKTKGSKRNNPIPQELFEMIKVRQARQENEALEARKLGKEYDINRYLFKQKNGRPINPNSYSKAFKRLLRAYNKEHGNNLPLPDICLYDARHSFATNLIAVEKIQTELVAPLMGNTARVCNELYLQAPSQIQVEIISGYANGIFKKETAS